MLLSRISAGFISIFCLTLLQLVHYLPPARANVGSPCNTTCPSSSETCNNSTGLCECAPGYKGNFTCDSALSVTIDDGPSVRQVQGRSVMLTCTVIGTGSITVRWIGPSNNQLTSDGKYNVTDFNSSTNKSSLSISNLLTSDNGSYKCSATDDSGTRENSIQLTVIPLSTVSIDSGHSVRQVQGRSVMLTCTVIGTGAITVRWIGPSNNQLTSDGKYNLIDFNSSTNKSSLSISNLLTSDNGSYKCSATDDSGIRENSTQLTVIPLSTVSIDIGPSVRPVQGLSIMLTCTVIGTGSITVRWIGPSNNQLTSGGKYNVTDFNSSTNKSSLSISNLLTSDNGSYKCSATDDSGTWENSTQLTVILVVLGDICSSAHPCTSNNSICNNSNNGTCICGSGFYDDNGSLAGGSCVSKVGLGSMCPQPDACSTSFAVCGISAANVYNICVCDIGYYDNNGRPLNGECTNVTLLQVSEINYLSIIEESITISWKAPTDQAAVSYYFVEHQSVSNNIGSSGVGTGQNVGNNTSATLTNLVPGQQYSIKITSVNTNTASSNRSAYVEVYQISKPSSPGNLTKNMDIDVSSGNITLQWRNSVGVVTGYGGALKNASLLQYNQTFTTSGPVPNQTFYGVKSGTWYTFTVWSISGFPNTQILHSVDHTEFIKTTVLAPDPPLNVQCSAQSDTYIQLTWNTPVNPNGDLHHYIITVNRTGPTPGIAYNITTATADLFYQVNNLSEGSFHTFQIYTVNEKFESATASVKQQCETRSKKAEPPTNLKKDNVTSRSFTISWNQPNNVFGELVGYILIINNTETKECVVEEFTNCSTGCKSAFPNQTVVAPTCSQKTKYQGVDYNELIRTRNFIASFGTFDPDTIYKVTVVAVNQGGMGNIISINVTTLEEVPKAPYNISVTDKQATNAIVGWSIDGPRPGKTTYTIIANGDYPARRKIYTVPDFSTRSSTILDLEEYWNYSLSVIAGTSQGSNESYSVTFKTAVAPAGNVSNFNVREGSGDDTSITAIISWSLPVILERNGPINSFSVLQETMVNGTFVQINSRNVAIVSDESNLYSSEFQVQREQLHRFIVFAFNGMNGSAISMNYSAKAVEKPSTVGALAGGIAGGVAALILIAVISVILWRRKSNKLRKARRLSNDATESNMENLNKIRKKRPINLATFAEYVADYHKDSNLKFSEEYEDLKTLSPQHSHEAADMEENRLKNRFVNILPFDHSRVRLLSIDDVPGSDYINANYLPGFSKTREYIACQGPIPATIDDHWRLIWEQNVRVIVMLTQYKEENRVKCEPYMPLEPKEPKQYGDIVVECLTYSSMNSFEYRTLKIRLGEKERTVKHFHFLSWRDYSANVQFDTMIDFIKKVRSFIQPPDVEGPMIVHCSAGVGRTGTYITIDHMIQHIDKYGADSTVDIFNFVLKMRENRTTMVQTEQQYIFIHDCIKDYLDRFKTYENEAFIHNEDENLYQNTEALEMYQNVNFNSTQKTEL